MFTVLQLLGLVLVVTGATLAAGIPGALVAVGAAAVYVGLAGER